MISDEIYQTAKKMFLNGCSLRKIEKILSIDRKKISLMLRNEGIYTDKKISKEKIKKAQKMLGCGNKITAIADILRIDRHTLSKELKNRNVRTPQNYKRNVAMDDDILYRYTEENKSIKIISSELNVSTNLVWNCLLAHNMNESDRLYRKYEYNIKRFKSIHTEEEAYWLGFLYADGYIDVYGNAIELSLKKQDENHVIAFRDFVGNCKTYDKMVDGHMQHRVNVLSKALCSNLIANGCMNAKTFILQFPTKNIVSHNLMHHFIRGYFDADGCICSIKSGLSFSIVGASYGMIAAMYDCIVKSTGIRRNSVTVSIKNRKNPLYHAGNSARVDINKIFSYLYKDATVFLKRKYDKFSSCKQLNLH